MTKPMTAREFYAVKSEHFGEGNYGNEKGRLFEQFCEEQATLSRGDSHG